MWDVKEDSMWGVIVLAIMFFLAREAGKYEGRKNLEDEQMRADLENMKRRFNDLR